MRDIKTLFNKISIWFVLMLVCAVSFVLIMLTLDMLMSGPRSVSLDKTANNTKEVIPTGELYLLSSIQEDYIMSNDDDVQKILTSFKVNLGQNVVGSSKLDSGLDCSNSNLERIRQTIENNNKLTKFAENLELKQFVALCEKENKQRAAEKNKAFVITLSEKCGYYIDFADAEHAPKVAQSGSKSLTIDYTDEAMKVLCLPQKIQFLSNVEEFWAENADDRPIDQIKELLEKKIVSNFTDKYRSKASENAVDALKALFCAMDYNNIVINGTDHSCQTHE